MVKKPVRWPDYLPIPREDVFALGVVSLNYNQLEGMFGALFEAVTMVGPIQASAIFYKLPNDKRQDVLLEIMERATLPAQLKESIRYFCTGFRICAENRHDLMHSGSVGVYTRYSDKAHGLLLSRVSKSGKWLVHAATLADLRAIADEMHAFTLFGAWVDSDVRSYLTYQGRGEASSWHAPSRDKPLLPSRLNWHAQSDAPIPPSPPRSSRV
jgi:hypothetical protein